MGQETLRIKLNVKGKYETWMHGDSDPPTLARVLKADIKCDNGVMVNLVDHLLYSLL